MTYLLDLALQMQQPLADRKTFGLWKVNIAVQLVPKIQLKHTCKWQKKTQFQNTVLLLLLCKFQVLDQHWSKVSRAEEREREELHLYLSFSKLGHQMHLVAAMILHGGRLESFIDPQRKEGRCKLRGREIETRSRRRGGSAKGRRLTQ